MFEYKKLKLKNGVRAILIPHEETAAATVLALYEVGSRYEPAELSGASHYIEHMMFKGTTRRPDTLSISKDLDSVGADYNAFTGKDYTGYYIKLQADRLPLAVDMLEDMVYHSVYRPHDLMSERQVILEEIRMYDDNPMMLVEELMEEELFKGSTLGRRIAGSVESMMGIGREALVGYRDRFYVPQRTVVAVAGKFREKDAIKLLEKTYGVRPAAEPPKPFKKFSVGSADYVKTRVRLHKKDTEQVQLSLGFPAYPYGDPKLPALLLLSSILGGTMSSRLFLQVREKRGLCYFIRASINPYQDVGSLTIQSGLSKDRIHEALEVIMEELRKIRAKDVTKEELVRAKENLKGRVILSLEDSSQLADWYAKQELLQKKTESPEDRLKKIFAVTAGDIRRAAADVLRSARLSMAVIGPYDDEKPFFKHGEKL